MSSEYNRFGWSAIDASSDGALFAPESGDGMETVRSDTVATEDGDEGYEKGCMDEEEELDEVNGYHFVNCTTLFVAYIYVNSGRLGYLFPTACWYL